MVLVVLIHNNNPNYMALEDLNICISYVDYFHAAFCLFLQLES